MAYLFNVINFATVLLDDNYLPCKILSSWDTAVQQAIQAL